MPIYRVPRSNASLNSSEKKVLRTITAFYGDPNRDIFIYLQPRIRDKEPDFIIVDEDYGVIIVEVKAWAVETITKINPRNVTLGQGGSDVNPALKTNEYHRLVQGMLEAETALRNERGDCEVPITSVLWLTNISADAASQFNGLLERAPTTTVYSGGEASFQQLLDNPRPLTRKLIDTVRSIIFPEIWVQPRVAQDLDNEVAAPRAALDEEQEAFARSLTEGHFMVSGIPGSGKTVMLIARALHLLKENRDWSLLIVTYNKSLKSKLKSQFERNSAELRFAGIDTNRVEIKNFHELVKEVSGLAAPQNAPNEFWNEIQPKAALEKATPTYNAILVDEYQDFHPMWFEVLVKLLIKPVLDGETKDGSLFLAGDPLQAIYQEETPPWKSLRINVRGGRRSTCLKRSYRTAKIHIRIGLEFLLQMGFSQEVEKFYEGTEQIAPVAEIAGTVELLRGDLLVVVKHVHELVTRGIPPEDILILFPKKDQYKSFMKELPRGIRDNFNAGKNVDDHRGFATTYHSAKGLERRYVYLCFVDQLESQVRNAKKAAQLLYVGITRAASALYLHSDQGFGSDNTAKLKAIVDQNQYQ